MAGLATSSLWIGDLTEYMDENFLKEACAALGEYEVRGVKVIRQKFSNKAMGYGFLQFENERQAMETLSRLQGKVIPNTNPPIRFKLNHGVYKKASGQEFSLWVGDLDRDIGEEELFRIFASRYNSIRTARILRAPNGDSKGFGFIRFGNEEDYKDALVAMNGFRGCGTRPIRVSQAIPRKEYTDPMSADASPYTAASGSAAGYGGALPDYGSHYYGLTNVWQQSTGWEGYDAGAGGDTAHGYYGAATSSYPYKPYSTDTAFDSAMITPSGGSSGVDDDLDEYTLVEHDVPVNVDEMNKEMLQRSEEFWDALENSRWLAPDFEDVYGLMNSGDEN